jgi:hypothetical protein
MISERELLALLDEARNTEVPEGALTVVQIAAKLGRGDAWVRKQIKTLMAQGKIELVFNVPVRRMDGRWTTSHGYRIVGG